MPSMRAYTVYFYSKGGSCVLYFGVDGYNKKSVLKLGKAMAKLLEEHYKSLNVNWGMKLTIKVEEYKRGTA